MHHQSQESLERMKILWRLGEISQMTSHQELLPQLEKHQELMQVLFIGEFVFEKGVEELKPKTQFAVYPGDGKWYVAGDTWFRPSGNKGYFDLIEDKLRDLFTI